MNFDFGGFWIMGFVCVWELVLWAILFGGIAGSRIFGCYNFSYFTVLNLVNNLT